jgi:DNA-binding NarL/FixJ family response regulator
MIRILIAECHPILSRGLSLLLSDESRQVTEVTSRSDLLKMLRRQDFNLLLLGPCTTSSGGIELIRRVRLNKPELPILMLSIKESLQQIKRKLEAGINGYLTIDSEPEILLDAAEKVARGGRYIPPSVAEQLAFSNLTDEKTLPHQHLTERELSIFNLLIGGEKLSNIAEQLSISSKTVSTHKSRLMKKINVSSNAELVAYAIRHQLSDFTDS